MLDTADKTLIVCALGETATHKSRRFEISLTIGNVTKIMHFRLPLPASHCRSHCLCLLWGWPIENTFYTITNCNEIDLSRTNARRSRNPHKFWHTRDEGWLGLCLGLVWPVSNLPQFLARSRPQFTYILGLLLDAHFGQIPRSSPGILFNAFKSMNYAHCTLAQTSLLVVCLCPAWFPFYYQLH